MIKSEFSQYSESPKNAPKSVIQPNKQDIQQKKKQNLFEFELKTSKINRK